MTDYMLKFNNKEQAENELLAMGIVARVEGGVVGVHPHAVDVLGIIAYEDLSARNDVELRRQELAQIIAQSAPGETLDESVVEEMRNLRYVEPVIIEKEGYHVNIRTESSFPELESFRVFPKAPLRVWA